LHAIYRQLSPFGPVELLRVAQEGVLTRLATAARRRSAMAHLASNRPEALAVRVPPSPAAAKVRS